MGPGWKLIAVAAAFSVATAASAQEPSPWEGYPERAVERPLLPLARGFVISLDTSSLSTKTAYDQDGELEDLDDTYNVFRAAITLEYGVFDRLDLLVGIPYITGEIGETSGGGLGDLTAGAMVSVFSSPAFEAVLGVRASAPTGDSDYQFDHTSDEPRLMNFRTGDPGVNYYPVGFLRVSLGDFKLLGGGYMILTGEGEVMYDPVVSAIEEEMADPGDGYFISGEVLYQFSPRVVGGVGASYLEVGETEIDGEGLGDEINLFEVTPQLMFQIAPETDLSLDVDVPVSGKNAAFGYTISFGVTTRF